jgi:hypothetical protein
MGARVSSGPSAPGEWTTSRPEEGPYELRGSSTPRTSSASLLWCRSRTTRAAQYRLPPVLERLLHRLLHPATLTKQGAAECSTVFQWHFPRALEADFAATNHGQDRHCDFFWHVGTSAVSCPSVARDYLSNSTYLGVVQLRSSASARSRCVREIRRPVRFRDQRSHVVASPVYTYAPVLYIAQGEKYGPSSTRTFIAASQVFVDKPDAPYNPNHINRRPLNGKAASCDNSI